eukprot:gene9370-12625_t
MERDESKGIVLNQKNRKLVEMLKSKKRVKKNNYEKRETAILLRHSSVQYFQTSKRISATSMSYVNSIKTDLILKAIHIDKHWWLFLRAIGQITPITKINFINYKNTVFRLYGSEFAREESSQPKVETNESQQPSEESKVIESKPEISNSMKEKLRAELRSQGADPNYSAGPVLGNPILIISFIVAVLVVAGGKGILY